MRAGDIMTTIVIFIQSDASILDAARLLLSERISALPVVDAEERLLGIVSEGDLIRRTEIGSEKRPTFWASIFADDKELAADYLKAHGRKVSDVMTHRVIVAQEDTTLAEVAVKMEKFNIKRIPIVRSGKIVGIVSRANLLQALIATPRTIGISTGDDTELRREILRTLDGEPWSSTVIRNVIVRNGHVELWGRAESAVQSEACRVAVEAIAGVESVENHLVVTSRNTHVW